MMNCCTFLRKTKVCSGICWFAAEFDVSHVTSPTHEIEVDRYVSPCLGKSFEAIMRLYDHNCYLLKACDVYYGLLSSHRLFHEELKEY